MIVPGMTIPEISASIMKDYETELRAKINALRVTHKRKWQLNGNKDFIETLTHQTKSHNAWRIVLHCKQTHVSVLPYLIAYNDIGVTASHLTVDNQHLSCMYFNTHFFKRYKERGKIEIDKPEELVKFFFKKNMPMMPSYWDFEDGRLQLFTPLRGGLGLGIYHQQEEIYEFKTFVDDSLLRDDQKAKVHATYMEILANSEQQR